MRFCSNPKMIRSLFARPSISTRSKAFRFELSRSAWAGWEVAECETSALHWQWPSIAFPSPSVTQLDGERGRVPFAILGLPPDKRWPSSVVSAELLLTNANDSSDVLTFVWAVLPGPCHHDLDG